MLWFVAALVWVTLGFSGVLLHVRMMRHGDWVPSWRAPVWYWIAAPFAGPLDLIAAILVWKRELFGRR